MLDQPSKLEIPFVPCSPENKPPRWTDIQRYFWMGLTYLLLRILGQQRFSPSVPGHRPLPRRWCDSGAMNSEITGQLSSLKHLGTSRPVSDFIFSHQWPSQDLIHKEDPLWEEKRNVSRNVRVSAFNEDTKLFLFCVPLPSKGISEVGFLNLSNSLQIP